MSGGQTFEIVDGVRRAKAFEMAGAKNIRACVLNDDGTLGPEMEVAIDELLSPHKATIEMSTNPKAERFWKIWRGIQGGKASHIPPITIMPGHRGTPVKDISLTY